jgi:5-methylcytosine-specific restriction endonuclease McrA
MLITNQVQARNVMKRRSIRHKSLRKCAICGKEGPLEVDHIIPKDKGGSDHILNLQYLCRKCNAKKGSKLNYNPDLQEVE